MTAPTRTTVHLNPRTETGDQPPVTHLECPEPFDPLTGQPISPLSCDCTLRYPATTREEAAATYAEVLSVQGVDPEAQIEYFTCRFGAWHWVATVEETTCPCGRISYASVNERNHAGRHATARHSTDTVRARYFTGNHGGHHWTWGPAQTAKPLKQCRCGSTRFSCQEDAETVAEHFRALHPESEVTVYKCHRPRWHVRVDGPGAQHHPSAPQFDRCQCGKAASATEQEARSLHERIIAHLGVLDDPVKFYSCRHDSRHWTKDVVYRGCACGEVIFDGRGEAIREAHAAGRRHRATEDVEARAYRCRHGS